MKNEDESNRFEIYSLKLNCVLQLCTLYSGYLLFYICYSFIFKLIISGKQHAREYAYASSLLSFILHPLKWVAFNNLHTRRKSAVRSFVHRNRKSMEDNRSLCQTIP